MDIPDFLQYQQHQMMLKNKLIPPKKRSILDKISKGSVVVNKNLFFVDLSNLSTYIPQEGINEENRLNSTKDGQIESCSNLTELPLKEKLNFPEEGKSNDEEENN